MSGDLTPAECIANLLDSDASPLDVRNPQQLAEIIVEFLHASGFKIVANDAEDDE